MYLTEKRKRYLRWGVLFLAGFLLGVLLMNMGNEVFLTEKGIFGVSVINRLKYMEIDSGSFLRYVLQKRLGSCLGIVLLSMTSLGAFFLYGFICWQGLLTGMTVTAALIRFGVKGLLLIMGVAFPHQLLIFPASVMLLGWCCENRERNIYYKNRRSPGGRQFLLLAWIGMIFLISSILESYVNPLLLTDILKIF